MNRQEQDKKMSQLIARCWADETFKKKLLADPAAVLKAEGVAAPAGVQVRAVENTDKVFHLVIPTKPTEMSDEELGKVAGGWQCAVDPFCQLPDGTWYDREGTDDGPDLEELERRFPIR